MFYIILLPLFQLKLFPFKAPFLTSLYVGVFNYILMINLNDSL